MRTVTSRQLATSEADMEKEAGRWDICDAMPSPWPIASFFPPHFQSISTRDSGFGADEESTIFHMGTLIEQSVGSIDAHALLMPFEMFSSRPGPRFPIFARNFRSPASPA
tara:strand:+ start:252 stop:581 length:330 start_codon:yes stop_codon:yes gene_type:complete